MKQQQAIQYLAFDVHQATVVATLRDESGKVVMRATVPTEAKAILTLVKSAGPRVHVAFEEGTQAQWLHDLLIGHAERVIVCNVRGRSETVNTGARACPCLRTATWAPSNRCWHEGAAQEAAGPRVGKGDEAARHRGRSNAPREA
jgi:hypothetical protein